MTARDFRIALKQWERALKRATTRKAEKTVRAKLKEDLGMILVREYTVPSYFRPARAKVQRKLRAVA